METGCAVPSELRRDVVLSRCAERGCDSGACRRWESEERTCAGRAWNGRWQMADGQTGRRDSPRNIDMQGLGSGSAARATELRSERPLHAPTLFAGPALTSIVASAHRTIICNTELTCPPTTYHLPPTIYPPTFAPRPHLHPSCPPAHRSTYRYDGRHTPLQLLPFHS